MKSSWRDLYRVHPAADVFPMLPEDELRKLGEDIKKNGLNEPIVLWSSEKVESEARLRGEPNPEKVFVLDGRNRLDAMELVGMTVLDDLGLLLGWIQNLNGEKNPKWPKANWVALPHTPSDGGPVIDPASYVVSKNIRRRHLTKEQQADLIVKVMQADTTDRANVARSVKRDSNGRLQGSAKDPVKEKIVDEAKKHGISERTVKRALTKARGTKIQERRKTTKNRTDKHYSRDERIVLDVDARIREEFFDLNDHEQTNVLDLLRELIKDLEREKRK